MQRSGNPTHSNEPLVTELRAVIAELQHRLAAMERYNSELRSAVIALMEPDTPRILRTLGGIIVLDQPLPPR